ncbi:MAG TPA: helicase-related protein [Candidatus Thermoplasmatota archaeon]|nr:helicase-related protein [Candidatus Thermoplasmatota archaeon]
MVFVLHPLLKPDRVEGRDYQVRLAQLAREAPTLVVLPTGLGKTIIALLAALPFLEKHPAQKVLVLAPTKPLVEQHARAFRDCLENIPVVAFTGETGPADRDKAWTEARIIVSTPQVIENDLVRGARDLRDVGFLVFDEAHRATGHYPYVFIARRYREVGGTHALGLTASPGSDLAKIQAILHHLGLQRIEVRTDQDADVQPYIHAIETEWVRVKPTTTLVRVIQLLTRSYVRAIAQLRRLGMLPGLRGAPNRKDLIELGVRIRREVSSGHGRHAAFEAASVQARALKIQHALELAETQGLTVLHRFLARVQAEAEQAGGTRAARDFSRDPEFAEALALSGSAAEPHPKVGRLVELVRAQLASGARRVLVFANYRETAELIVGGLSAIPECRAHRFVGHATASGEKGLTKKGQQQIVDRFRSGDLNVLVATSVAEEGLDLPETDAVVLYEPVPSGIRMIQRRGRTGRRSEGKVFVLLTEGTRDEQYHWSALRREKRMHEELVFLRRNMRLPTAPPPPPPAARPASPEAIEIVVDAREAPSSVPKLLLERGIVVKTASLQLGDYAVGGGYIVERKTPADFVASLRDGRLFDQARRLSDHSRAVLVIEGDLAEIHARLPPAAFLGATAALLRDFRLSVVNVADAAGTAELLVALARRSRNEGAPSASRFQKRQGSDTEELRFILEGITGVGPVLAARLLEAFGTVAAVAHASQGDLERVEGVGADRARTLHEVLNRRYASMALPFPSAQLPVVEATLESGDGAAR